MQRRNVTLLTGLGLVLIGGTAAFLLPDSIVPSAAAHGGHGRARMRGVVRDFSRHHPDFDVMHSPGPSAGNIARRLDRCGRPVWSREFHDFVVQGGQAVPQRVFATRESVLGAAITSGGDPVPVTAMIRVGDEVIEPYGPFESPVGGDVNTGAAEPMHAVMPDLYDAETPVSVVGRSWTLIGGDGSEDGDWAPLIEADSSDDSPQVMALRDGDPVPDIDPLEDQASIAEYLANYLDTETGTVRLAPNEVIYLFELGTTNLASAAADFQDLVVLVSFANSPDDFAPGATASAGSSVTATYYDADGRPMAPHLYDPETDTAGARGAAADGGVTSTATFTEWFTDVPGTNASSTLDLTLTRNPDGVYEYLDDSFYPADGRLLGNDGETHNNYFTAAFATSFTYDADAEQFVHFEGGDGAWLFVNGELVIDLGGVQTGAEQYAMLDRLGLTDGDSYELEVFYAQRSSAGSTFRFRTNLELAPDTTPATISAMFD